MASCLGWPIPSTRHRTPSISEVYGALARSGVRIISNSWGSQPPSEKYDTLANVIDAYRQHEEVRAKSGAGSWLDAAAKASRGGVVNNFSAGNSGYGNASMRGAYPYFHPELEGNWLTTTGYSQTVGQVYNQCGIAKWWCVMAPTGVESLHSTEMLPIHPVPATRLSMAPRLPRRTHRPPWL